MPSTSENVGLLVLLTAKPGKADDVADFLRSALPMAQAEPQTISWYAVRLDDRRFGIYDTFADEAGRQAHLNGEIAKALMGKADDLFEDFDATKDIQTFSILASIPK